MAVASGARSADLLTLETAHHFLDGVRAAGIRGKLCILIVLGESSTFRKILIFGWILRCFTVPAPPAWVVDTSTMETFRDAIWKKIPPRKLNSRADTELFLLNIVGRLF